jgi:hypothetical protein
MVEWEEDEGMKARRLLENLCMEQWSQLATCCTELLTACCPLITQSSSSKQSKWFLSFSSGKTKRGVVVHACNPNTQELEARRSRVWLQASLDYIA